MGRRGTATERHKTENILEDSQVKQLILDLLKNPGERDKQRMIGASEIGNPCDYCLANRLLNTPKATSQYWLGAKLGTAMHRELEYEEAKHVEVPQNYRFEALEGARIEETITLGDIPGYGTVRSKPDLVLTKYNHVIDHKSTTKTKVSGYKLDGVPRQYVIQQQLYAWGLNKSGIEIDRISLSFVNRDGLTDKDVWIHTFNYDETVALAAWSRLESAWAYVSSGGDVENISSDSKCYYCTQVLHRW